MGLSVYAKDADALKCARTFPKLGSKVARLTLTPAAGKVLPTPSRSGESHHTWWQVDGGDPVPYIDFVIDTYLI